MMKRSTLFFVLVLLFRALSADAQTTRWYSYADYQYYQSVYVYGQDVGIYYMPMWNDTSAKYGFINSSSLPEYTHVSNISAGMAFAPRLSTWNDVTYYGATIKVGPTDIYTIDSVRLHGTYLRNNSKLIPKDTIKLGFVYGDGSTSTSSNILNRSLSSGPYGPAPFIDMVHDSIKNVAGKAPLSSINPYMQNIILASTDTATVYNKAFAVNGTTGFSVPAGNFAAMSLTFKSGDASYTPNDTIIYASGARKYGSFAPYVQYNARYTGGPVDYAVYDPVDSNVGYFKDAKSSPFGWAGLYVPTWAWTSGGGLPSAQQYPYIDFHITCPACDLSDTIAGTPTVCVSATTSLSIGYTGGAWTSKKPSVATVTSLGVVSGVAPGIDTIVYTLSGHKAIVVVTVLPLPSAGIIVGPGALCGTSFGTYTISGGSPGGVWTSSNTTVLDASGGGSSIHAVGVGVAVLSYAVTTACGTAYATKSINVFPSTAGTILGPTTVCQGATIALSNIVTSGTWTSTATGVATVDPVTGVVTGVGAGTSSIVYSVLDMCSTITSTSVTITVQGLPDAGSLSGNNTVCVDSGIMLTPSISGGSWVAENSHAVVVLGVVVGVSAGVDPIYYIVTNSCGSDTAIYNVTVGDCVNAVDNVPSLQDINIYPNPAQTNITISSSAVISSVTISNMVGQELIANKYTDRAVTIGLEPLPAGIYMVKVNNAKVYKILKQ